MNAPILIVAEDAATGGNTPPFPFQIAMSEPHFRQSLFRYIRKTRKILPFFSQQIHFVVP